MQIYMGIRAEEDVACGFGRSPTTGAIVLSQVIYISNSLPMAEWPEMNLVGPRQKREGKENMAQLILCQLRARQRGGVYSVL